MILVFESIHLLSFSVFDALDLVHLKSEILVVPVEILLRLIVSVDFSLVFAFGSRTRFSKNFAVGSTHGLDEEFLVV